MSQPGETFLQFLFGILGVMILFFFSAIYKATLGHDPPLGEAAIGAIASISIGRTVVAGYSHTQIEKTAIQVTGTTTAGTVTPGVPPPV